MELKHTNSFGIGQSIILIGDISARTIEIYIDEVLFTTLQFSDSYSTTYHFGLFKVKDKQLYSNLTLEIVHHKTIYYFPNSLAPNINTGLFNSWVFADAALKVSYLDSPRYVVCSIDPESIQTIWTDSAPELRHVIFKETLLETAGYKYGSPSIVIEKNGNTHNFYDDIFNKNKKTVQNIINRLGWTHIHRLNFKVILLLDNLYFTPFYVSGLSINIKPKQEKNLNTMKCPICKGEGENQVSDVDWDDCRYCNATGKVKIK